MVIVNLCSSEIVDLTEGNQCTTAGCSPKAQPLDSALGEVKAEVCAICLDGLDGGGTLITTRCAHTYHEKCMSTWLSHGRQFCPRCRTNRCLPGMEEVASSSSSRSRSPQVANVRGMGSTTRGPLHQNSDPSQELYQVRAALRKERFQQRLREREQCVQQAECRRREAEERRCKLLEKMQKDHRKMQEHRANLATVVEQIQQKIVQRDHH